MFDSPEYILLFCLTLSIICGCKSSATEVENVELTDLFLDPGKDCYASGKGNWQLEKGLLTGTGESGFIVTSEPYDDFVLTVEFMPDKNVNSGIFIRCPKDEFTPMTCYEINIWDDHVNQDFRTGSIVTHAKPLDYLETVGKWNRYKIKAHANRIEVWLNGKKTADLTSETSSSGYVALQVNGGKIQFKNIKIQIL